MTGLICLKNNINERSEHYSSFLIEPLNKGQSITVGNAIRRTLLSELIGFCIVNIQLNNLRHEFEQLDFMKEDTLELMIALQEIIFKEKKILSTRKKKTVYGTINLQGPLVVTAGMVLIPCGYLDILNKDHYICTLADKSELTILIKIQNKAPYKPLFGQKSFFGPQDNLANSAFNPIKRVTYKTRIIFDKQGNLKESLVLEIISNGSITPKRSIQNCLKLLLQLFYPLICIVTLKKLAKQPIFNVINFNETKQHLFDCLA